MFLPWTLGENLFSWLFEILQLRSLTSVPFLSHLAYSVLKLYSFFITLNSYLGVINLGSLIIHKFSLPYKVTFTNSRGQNLNIFGGDIIQCNIFSI